MLEAKIKFFDVTRCGYYFRGNTAPLFGDITDTLTRLNAWANDGKALVNTTCYQPNPDKDLLNTYFCGWSNNTVTGDSVLVLWNQTTNDNGVIYGMNPSSPPGQTNMLSTDFGDEPAIPGAPSYIWFIPKRNVFATIRFNHSVQGKVNLSHYINGFLQNKSPYRVLNASGKVTGYSLNGEKNDQSERLNARFEAFGRKQKELEAELIKNINKISKIVKRETLVYSLEDDRSAFERVFSKLLNNSPNFQDARTIRHELEFSPTESQLKEIIKNFDELGSETFIENAGFKYKDGRTIMLSGTSVAFPHSFNITRDDNQLISPNTLLNAVNSHRTDLLRPLDDASFTVNEANEND